MKVQRRQKNLHICALLKGSHIYVFAPVLHLVKLLAKWQLPEQPGEFGQILVARTMMNICELPQIHLDDWHEEDNKICPLLCAEQETPIHPLHHSEGALRREASNQERSEKCAMYFKGNRRNAYEAIWRLCHQRSLSWFLRRILPWALVPSSS